MNNDIRLSISEASKLFGISQRTIRRAIANNALDYTLVQGRYKISFESLLHWSQASTLISQKRDTNGIGQYVATWKISGTPTTPNVTHAAQMSTPQAAPIPPSRQTVKRVSHVKTATTSTSTTGVPTTNAQVSSNAVPAPAEPTLTWD